MNIDSVQLVLLFVIIVLTLLLVVLGVQVFFILREVRRTLFKANKVLDTADTIADAVFKPLSSFGGISGLVSSGSFMAVAKIIRSFLKRDDHKDRHHEE